MGKGVSRRVLLALGGIGLLAGVAYAQAQGGLTALAGLQPGRWEVRELDNPRAVPRTLCVRDLNSLTQIQHRGLPCSRMVIANEAKSGTVHYTCPDGGFGRTTIRVVTPRALVIDTQGIHEGRPFEYRADARRKGACSAR